MTVVNCVDVVETFLSICETVTLTVVLYIVHCTYIFSYFFIRKFTLRAEMFQVRKLPSSVRYLVVFVSGMASLLSGASLVHYIFKPDLVSESMITSYNFNFNVIYLILF